MDNQEATKEKSDEETIEEKPADEAVEDNNEEPKS